jgi:WD40 repeat protein
LAFLAEAIRLLGASGPTRFLDALLNDGDLQKFPANCRERLADVEVAAGLCDRQLDKRTAELVADVKKNIADIADRLGSIETKIDFAKLPTAPGARHDASQSGLTTCLEETRVDIMEEICRWANDPSGECFYWLQGNAGEGKSTIARTIAETLEKQGVLGASFFFTRNHPGRGNAGLFFSTIADQLVPKIDGLGSAIAKVLDAETRSYDKSIQIQFETLIAAPLESSSQPLRLARGGLVIVVDALDECFDDDVKQLVTLLARAGSFGIRTFITSRPDEPVVSVLRCLKGAQCREAILETHTQATIDHDISLFLTKELKVLRSNKPTLATGWPGQDRVEELTRRSVPLFIFAATVCRFLSTPGSTPEELLHIVLEEPSRLPLTMIYRPILERWLTVRTPLQGREAAIAEFRNIVGPVLFSAESLPVSLAAMMSGLAIDKLEARLDLLRSVLQTSKHDGNEHYTIKAFHLSFQDFIVKSEESLGFKIDERQTHQSMTAACLSLMMQPGKLRQDICAVGKPGTRRLDIDTRLINTQISPDLAYACRYWLYHQVRSGQVLDDNHQIYKFLACHFLYWFEAMAWLGKAYEVLPFLKQLKPFIDLRQADASPPNMECAGNSQDTRSTKLRELVEDIQYFIRDFSYIADQAPLQLYASALTFAPKSSLVKSLFKNCMPKWLVLQPKVTDDWEESHVLEGHTRPVTAMTFSSGEECLATEKEYLATCSEYDRTLRVWDCATGDCILKIPGQNNRDPYAVSFSHDSQYLAAAFVNRFDQNYSSITAIIYDVKTGKVIEDYDCIRAGFPKHYHLHLLLAFGPDSSSMLYIAIFYEGMLELWCTKPGSHTFEHAWSMRTPHEYFTISARTSLISGFSVDDRNITSWRLDSGAYVSTHSIEMVNSRFRSFYFDGFVDCRSRDLIYRIASISPKADGDVRFVRSNVQKLNTQTSRTTLVTSIESNWSPQAICLSTGLIALTKHYTSAVHLLGLLQRPKTDRLTRHMSTPNSVDVAQEGEMILIRYKSHIELRDVLGDVVFRISEVSFRSDACGNTACVSGDGSVVIAELKQGTHVWFVKSGREVTLPRVGKWLCLPAVSNDSKLLAFCSKSTRNTRRMKDAGLQKTIGDRLVFWDLENSRQVKIVDRSYERRDRRSYDAWMFFSEDQKTLHTDKGDVNIETGDWKPNSLHHRDGPERSISKDGSWLQIHGEDLLWLPESHRPRRRFASSFGKNTIAYPCSDRSVLTMKVVYPHEFSDSPTP